MDANGASIFKHFFASNAQFEGSNCAPKLPNFVVKSIQKKRTEYLSELYETLGLVQNELDNIAARSVHQVT
jgi:hypothetical protein